MTARRAPRLRSLLAATLVAPLLVPLSASPALAAPETLTVDVLYEDGLSVFTDGIPGMTVRAILVDGSGDPIQGAGGEQEIVEGIAIPTDPDGRYRLTLDPGSWKIEAFEDVENTTSSGNPSEYARVWSGNAATFQAATAVSIDGVGSSSITVESPVAGFIYVTTTADTTNEFIGGICATAYDAATGAPVASTASTSTTLQLRALRPGNYRVEFARDPFLDGDCDDATSPAMYQPEWYLDQSSFGSATNVEVVENTTTSISASLAPVDNNRSITGTVTANGGGALSAIQVSATPVNTSGTATGSAITTTTNSSGGYSLALSAGRYKVGFDDFDTSDSIKYASEFWNNKPSFGTATIVDLTTANATGINAGLDVSGSISGTVTKPDGSDADTNPDPAEGATVELYRKSDGTKVTTNPATITTTADGTYTISGLFPDTYRMKVIPSSTDASNGIATEWYQNASDLSTATDIALASGQNRTGINTLLDQAAAITGTVTSPDGPDAGTEPDRRVGICVAAYTPGGTFAASTTTSDDVIGTTENEAGTYSLGLAQGQYRLRFSDGDDANCGATSDPEWASQWRGGVNFETATTVTLGSGGLSGQNVTLVDGAGILSGTATKQADGSFAKDVCVRVFDSQGRVLREVVTNASGFWRAPGLAPQTVRVEYRPDLTSGDDCYTTAADRLGGTGTAVDQGPSSANGNIGLGNRHYLDKTSLSDATPVVLEVDADKPGINQALPRVDLNAPAGTGTASITGTVTEPDGPDGGSAPDPVEGVCVVAVLLNWDGTEAKVVNSVTSDSSGAYTLGGLAADTLFRVRYSNDSTLCSNGTGFNVTEWYANKTSFSTANAVRTNADNSPVTGINETIPYAGLITGQVTDLEEGGGIAATVNVYKAEDLTLVRSVQTNANGTYKVGALPLGDYKVGFVPSAPNYRPIFFKDAGNLAAATVITVGNSTSTNVSQALKRNNAPVAGDDARQAEVNTAATFVDLRSNDVDPDGDEITITAVGTPSHGTATLNTDGSVTYTPETDNTTAATFTYTVRDPGGLTDTATVTVEIVGEIQGLRPIAQDDTAVTASNTPVTIPVLANDSDPDGDDAALTIVNPGNPFHGTAVVVGRDIRYTPDTDFAGTDQFAYTIRDSQGFESSARVTVTVNGSSQNRVDANVTAGGTVGTDGANATADNPVITTVTSPNAGRVVISEEETSGGTTGDIALVNWKVEITAPNATASIPLVITFRLDGSLLEGLQPHRALRILRDGTLVGNCLGASTASPNPCVSGRRKIGDDVLITVRTSQASRWNFGFDDDAVVDRATGASGTGRVGTAVDVSRHAFTPAEVDTVLIARKDAYPDALAGAPLAFQLGAPLLLTTSDSLDAITREEIVRLGAQRIVILGGTAAVSTGVESQLRSIPGVQVVDRIRGANRFETAAQIAAQLDSYDTAYVVEGIDADPARGWPDAVSVASLAAFEGRPILLTSTEELPTATRNALAGLSEAVIIGGTASVSTAVAQQIDQVVGAVGRVRGTDRYETSFEVVARARAAGMSVSSVWVATGLNFPDALAAGPAVAKEGGVLILVNGKDYDASPAVERLLTQNRTSIEVVTITGGTAAVSVGAELRIRGATEN